MRNEEAGGKSSLWVVLLLSYKSRQGKTLHEAISHEATKALNRGSIRALEHVQTRKDVPPFQQVQVLIPSGLHALSRSGKLARSGSSRHRVMTGAPIVHYEALLKCTRSIGRSL